ncbi:MAG: AGE family epimerase/isomerase [Cellvibrionaceae bacterium]|nr:AGE family epimerase/isomerase [Cellvibrionaceae bacterium]
MNPQVADALSRFVSWVKKDALPLWLERALHVPGGWFSAQLSASGRPVVGEVVHLASQAQMLYVICRAEQLGWLSGKRKLARSIIDFAGRHGTLPCRSDGYVRSLQSSFEILDAQMDPADHAWFVMANTACFAAFSDMLDLRRVYNIVDWLNIHFADGSTWLDSDRKSRGPPELLRLMLRAYVYLDEVTQKPVWRQRAQRLFHYCSEEYFSAGEGATELCSAGRAELFAWVKLLCHYERRIGGALELAERVYQQSYVEMTPGIKSKEFGGLVLTESLGAGLELCASGEGSEEDVLSCVTRIFDQYLSRDVPGMFVDEPQSPNSTGSVATLVSLFDAAVSANRLLLQK